MKRKLLVLVSIVLSLSVCLSGCKTGDALFIVNGEPILDRDYDRIKYNYEYSDEEIFEGLILEMLVLQYGKKGNISVSDAYIENAVQTVKEMDLIYEKAIETYGTLENYKEALVNRYIYEEVKQDVISEYAATLTFSEQVLKEGVDMFLEENNYEYNEFSDNEILQLKESLKENYTMLLSNIYFDSWNYSLLKNASIKYIQLDKDLLFQMRDFDEDKDAITIGDTVYQLKQTTINDASKRFGSIINFYSTQLSNTYEFVDLKESSNELRSIKVLEIKLVNKENENSVNCDIVLNPLNYKNDKNNGKMIDIVNGHQLIKYAEEYYIYDSNLQIIYRFYNVNMTEESLVNLISILIKYGYMDIQSH